MFFADLSLASILVSSCFCYLLPFLLFLFSLQLISFSLSLLLLSTHPIWWFAYIDNNLLFLFVLLFLARFFRFFFGFIPHCSYSNLVIAIVTVSSIYSMQMQMLMFKIKFRTHIAVFGRIGEKIFYLIHAKSVFLACWSQCTIGRKAEKRGKVSLSALFK